MQELGTGPDQGQAKESTASNEENNIREWLEKTTGQSNELDQEFGRLVVGEGKTRYVANSLWASLSEQVSEFYKYTWQQQ